MQSVAVGFLGDLLAAAETVGYDEPVGRSLTDGGKKFQLADGFGDTVLFFFKTKSSSHATASGSGGSEVDPHAAEDGFFGGHLHYGFVMAVSVNERAARKFGEAEIAGSLFEKLAQQEDLSRQGMCALVLGEEIGQFVAENGGAAWFEDDDGRFGFDFGEQRVHGLEE